MRPNIEKHERDLTLAPWRADVPAAAGTSKHDDTSPPLQPSSVQRLTRSGMCEVTARPRCHHSRVYLNNTRHKHQRSSSSLQCCSTAYLFTRHVGFFEMETGWKQSWQPSVGIITVGGGGSGSCDVCRWPGLFQLQETWPLDAAVLPWVWDVFFGGGGAAAVGSQLQEVKEYTDKQRGSVFVYPPPFVTLHQSTLDFIANAQSHSLPNYLPRKNKREAPICHPAPVPVITLPFCRNTSVCLTVLLLQAGAQQEVLPPKANSFNYDP